MAKERPEGILEQILTCLQNMETHLGVLAKNPDLGTTQKKTEEVDLGLGEEAPPPSPVSLKDAQAALKKVIDIKGKPAAVKLLESFGFPRVSDIPEEKWPAFIAKCQE